MSEAEKRTLSAASSSENPPSKRSRENAPSLPTSDGPAWSAPEKWEDSVECQTALLEWYNSHASELTADPEELTDASSPQQSISGATAKTDDEVAWKEFQRRCKSNPRGM